MRFDNPTGFVALAAVAVLVLLVMRDRRRRTIPVGTLFLWQQVPSPPRDRQRFRPDPLFFAQLAIVLALVGAYVRPVREDAAAPPVGSPLVVVLDVSASMQTAERAGTRFEIARRRALARVAEVSPTDEILLVTAGVRPHVTLPWTSNRASVRAALEALAPFDTPTDLAPALELAGGLADERPGAHVAVFTDLPPEASGLTPEARARLDYVQIGSTDDNVGIAGVVVTTPPFHGPTDTTATVDVRNYARVTHEAVLEARVAGLPWARRALTIAPRATEHVLLTRPPASGLVDLRLVVDDAFAVDDHASAWIGAGKALDLLLVTDSRALADAFAGVTAALAGSRVEVMSRARYETTAAAGRRVALFDGFVPATLPLATNALYVAPPAGNDVCPSAGRRDDAVVVDWDAAHPALAGLGALQAVGVAGTSLLGETEWGTPIVLAASGHAAFPLLIAGERNGRRTACLGAELAGPLASSDRLPLLLLTLATLRWLAEPFGPSALAVETGRPTLAGAGPTAPITGDGLTIAGDPPVVTADRVGVFSVGPPGAERPVLANLFDDRESDIGRNGAGEWPATVVDTRPTPVPSGRPLTRWLYGAALVLLALEWALWRRTPARARDRSPTRGTVRDTRRRLECAMTVHADTPAVLALLLLVPLLFVRPRGRGAGGRPALLATFLRGAAASALVALLAGVHLERARPAAGTCVIAAIDVSASVQHGAVDRAREVLDALLPLLGPDDLVGSVAFAARARVVARPARGVGASTDLLPAPATDLTGLESGDTDLAAAFTTASALCPSGKERALLLFTDGNETIGSLRAETVAAGTAPVVFPFVPRPGALPPAVIRRVLAPAFAPEHTVLPLELVVESRRTTPATAELQLVANDDTLTREHAQLAPGLNVVAMPYRLRGAGQYALEADLTLPGATEPVAGHARAAVAVTRPLHVLVVSERPAPVVATALAERGMHIEIVPPHALAAKVDELAGYHLVIFDDVTRAGLADATLEQLAAWVARGGGLIATGGEHFFGDGAFAGSALERVLPVTLQPQSASPQEREPIAIYLLIDRSNSMGYASRQPTLHNGEKMAYAKRAALAVLDQLGDRDLVATIAFDSQPYELGPLAPAGETRATLAAKIQQIQYGGGTDFKEALEIARRNLLASGRSVRHVVLLTDGDSNRAAEDHADVIAALARAEITVTSIRIGDDVVNLDLLDAISRATGGSFHHVEDVEQLPQLMIRDAQRLMGRATERRDLPPRAGDGGVILAGIAEKELPAVSRWAVVQSKHGAEVRLWVEDGEARDPLLATWQYELGRVAVVPLDFQGGAAAWPTWDGFAKLWTQLAEWAAPRGLPSDHRLAATRERDGTRIVLDTLDDASGPFTLRLDGVGDVALRQVGPRTFAATVPSVRPGVHAAVLGSGAGEDHVDLLVPATADGDRELRRTAPDRILLRDVARATGGAVDPEPARVVAARPGVRHETVPLDAILVPLALLLVLADVAIRRLVVL